MGPVIVIHGGASSSAPGDVDCPRLHVVKEVAKTCHRLLMDGASCVDAVVEAVSMLEDHHLFNAGKGSALNEEGGVQMHAMIMSGKNLDAGGAIAVENVKNPIKAARMIMEKSKHCVLQGNAVRKLAEKHGLQIMPDEYFVTEMRKEALKNLLNSDGTKNKSIYIDKDHDTIGAVALDMNGDLACATSTGGLTAQMRGRVGDSPLPGSGGFADNESVAVSTTGHGESFIRTCMARLIAFNVEKGDTPQLSTAKSIDYMRSKVQGIGGAIAVDRDGRVGIYSNSERMSWAVIGADLENQEQNEHYTKCPHVTYGIYPSVSLTENL